MTPPALGEIARLLAAVSGRGAYSARRTVPPDDLRLEVKGVGPLRFPVPRTQARALCGVARPARYGRGEETLLDEGVRDTWEVPLSRVKIDRRRWNRALGPLLDRLRADLGLPDGCTLKPSLHSMLVYEPGQFFLPHKDSEKADGMVATLVVTLPSAFKGGALVIQHGDDEVSYRASKHLAAIAFYADCRHEVRPVTDGYRISLTYNLALGDAALAPGNVDPEATTALARELRRHFKRARPQRWAGDDVPRGSIDRLVYLLDHQYTERGLAWSRLKGDDAVRAALLRAAGDQADCEAALALADVHESWSCEDEWDVPRYGRGHRWQRSEEGWHSDPESFDEGPDRYALLDLIDRGTVLERWIPPGSTKSERVRTRVDDHELCTTKPSTEFDPYASEYEGYMGNYGNTMDRWYRRAAVVVWPRTRAFAVRAEASPDWAVRELARRIRNAPLPEARALAASLFPAWEYSANREERRGFFGRALTVAEGLDDLELALRMLKPFAVEDLTPRDGPALAALTRRYGQPWAQALLIEWSPSTERPVVDRAARKAWLAALPDLCKALVAADDEAGTRAADLILTNQWEWLDEALGDGAAGATTRWGKEALLELAEPVLSFLEAAALVGAEALDHAVEVLCAPANEALLPCLVRVARPTRRGAAHRHSAPTLDRIRRHCVELLQARIDAPEREEGTWSIAPPSKCRCALCGTLTDFLSAADRETFEWPLAKEGRRHVHGVIDTHDLPVRHETRRSGRPFTLVLTKTNELFRREAAERWEWKAELRRLSGEKAAVR